ncbi:glycoside hydrolase family 15 protein [Bacillus taeanensis]|uniref:Glycoside hydrolase family 15 protein n=1 Tax=Bacillus taeanensis TaxID=273032 RepID=A0A366Y0I2_9BACI|nr:glycoside hydrolase family 15 protein [Bacillus taeanensis]RBW70549.1 glycoside hydrolase family 15 protein [Bacillus taeanensis]
MPRELVIGNGQLLVNLDKHLQIRDIYFPFVGQQNHVQGHPNRIGVWIDGVFSWLQSGDWQIDLNYHTDALVTCSKAYNKRLNVTLIVEEGVHQQEMILLRKFTVKNHEQKARKVRLFFHHDLTIYESEVGDTAYFAPKNQAMVHYKRNRYFLFNGLFNKKSIVQYTTGVKRFQSAEGTWRDAEDGQLHFHPISQGSVDSTFSLEAVVDAQEEKSAYYWMTVGKTKHEVESLNEYVHETGPELALERMKLYWIRWVNKTDIPQSDLTESMINLYKRCLLIIRTQTNVNGTIIAANDSDILQFNRDHYSYLWPRDGALIAAAVAKAGFHGMVANFYRRCEKLLSSEGYFYHKYNPDGSIGSSWHPFIDQHGKEILPIQEDETALVIWAFWQHYLETGDIEFAHSLYRSLVKPSGKFLMSYIDEKRDLPLPSYDLWEERRGVFSFTASTVYGGLMAAHHFANMFGEDELSDKFLKAAEKIKVGIETYLYDEEIGRFIRGIYYNEESSKMIKDFTIESSMYGLFAFDVFEADDPRIIRTMEIIEKELSIKTPVGGIARYFNDYYFQQTQNLTEAPGNPWLICTLWLAKWKIKKSKNLEDLKEAYSIFQWIEKQAFSSGVLPEQIHPYTGEPLSVAPLTWSHATYVDVVQDYLKAYQLFALKQS